MKPDYLSVFDAYPDLVLILDTDRRIIRANRAMVNRVGLQPEALKGATCCWLIHQRDEHPDTCIHGCMLKEEKEQSAEMLLEHLGGWFSMHMIPLFDQQGNITGSIHVLQDINARKQSELECRKKNELFSTRLAEKDHFISVVAHDLRSPFMTILGMSELFIDQTNEMTNSEMMEAARAIHFSAKNYFELLENLLVWSRSQNGLNVMECENILLVSFVNDFLRVNTETAAEKEIVITCDIPGGLTVYTIRHILQAVFRNIVANAVKFTHRGGAITISAKQLPGHPAEISIRDNGIGMSSKLADNLFSPGAKTSRKGTLGEESMGLGLMLCKFFIENQGGWLRIESAPGMGTAFHFTLGK